MQCPECPASLRERDNLAPGDRIFCPACGVELEVTHTDPLAVEVVYDFEEEEEMALLRERWSDLRWRDDLP
ncbi:MAG: lysine biosynthesis protein LysW [Chloroflexi bacterium]|jgi:lysine biosynthesis protein LysW|nr:lysine biosynthesis protein LysW [Chloroflexota bacterium]